MFFYFKYHGFTLLELVTVIAIVAIILLAGLPSFNELNNKVKRNDAKVSLLDLAAKLELYFSENHTYSSATIQQNPATDLLETTKSQEEYYELKIVTQTSTDFLIEAAPKFVDEECGALQLNELGERTITGTASAEYCW